MIKILLALTILLPAAGVAQVTMNMGFGGLNENKLFPAFKLSVQGEYRNIILEAAEIPSISRNINAGKFLGFSLGFRLWKLVPTAGYFYNLRSSDAKLSSLNGWNWKAGLKFVHMIKTSTGLYAEAILIGKVAGLTTGVVYTF